MAFNKKRDDSTTVELELLLDKRSDLSKNTVIDILQGNKSSTPSRDGRRIPRATAELEQNFAKKLLNAVLSRDPVSVRMALITKANVNAGIGEDELTALHFATAMGDVKIVETLLQFKADPHAEDRIGRTPFYIAAVMGNDSCLRAMIKSGAKVNTKVNLKSSGDTVQSSKTNTFLSAMANTIEIPTMVWDGSTALHEASRANSPKCIKILLAAKADVEAIDKRGVTPLLLAGAGLDASQKEAIASYEQVVKLLVAAGAKGDAHNDGMANSALLNAVFLGSLEALMCLMNANANPSWSSENGGRTTALHEAAGSGRADMLKALICHSMSVHNQRTLANLADAVKRTPLHKAAYAGAQDCVCILLECGADMGLKTGTGVSGIEAIMLYVPDSKVFLSSVLDSCITCNTPTPENPNFAVWVNFSLLAPEISDRQTAVLNALFTANTVPRDHKRTFLLHPLVEAFVRFKWSELRKYFILVVIVYVLFVVNLSICVTLSYLAIDHFNDSQWFYMYLRVSRYSTFLFATLVLLNVIGQCYIHFHYYLHQLETWTNGLSSIFSIIWMIAEEPSIKNEVQMLPWVNHAVSVSLPIAWAGLMLLLGRFPTWGSRALLFGVVLKNVIWTLLVLGCIIIGFSFSFFVQFHNVDADAFGDPWKAFFNTIVMMTGEYEYLNIFNSNKYFLPVTSRVLFFIFIVVATIVLLNLIVGLAVTDTQSMNTESETRSLYKRAEFVDLLESTVAPIARHSALNKTVKLKIHGRPLDKDRASIRILPTDVLDSLTKVALKQKRQAEDRKKIISGNLSLHPPITMEGTLQDKISPILEQFANKIIQAIEECNGAYVDNNLLSSTRQNISLYSSTHFKTVLNKVTVTQQSTKSS